MAQYPILYKKDRKGRVRTWTAYVSPMPDGSAVLGTSAGLLGGKMTIQEITITEGKNIGRSNETTPLEQAHKEAAALVQFKLNRDRMAETLIDDDEIHPAQAQYYNKYAHKLPEIVIAQPKLNGIRAFIRKIDGEIFVFSKRGVRYPVMEAKFGQYLKVMMQDGEILDGEFYIHGVALRLISSAVKKLGTLTPQVEFHVFDIPSLKMKAEDRLRIVYERFHNTATRGAQIMVVPSEKINKANCLVYRRRQEDLGFEGAMYRDPDGEYEGGVRGYTIMKDKDEFDSEFLCIDTTTDREGQGLLICVMDNGGTFEVRMTGPDYVRADIVQHPENWKGKMITVKYNDVLDSGIPQFARGIAVRDYE